MLNPSKKIHPSFARIYRYVRFRKGHGVHSPFAFGIINRVVEEKRLYYAYETIEQHLKKQHPPISFTSKYGRLLYRIVNFSHATTVLQVGAPTAWQSLYLSRAAQRTLVLDTETVHLQAVQRLSISGKSIETAVWQNQDNIDTALQQLEHVDVLYLHLAKEGESAREVFYRCLPYLHHHTVCILDGIHKKKMKSFWKELQARKDIPVTMDLYSLGLVFFNRKLHKKNYKLFF